MHIHISLTDAEMGCPQHITQHLISRSCCSLCDKLNRRFIIVSHKKRKAIFCLMFDPLFLQSSAKSKIHYVSFKHSKEELMWEEFNSNGQIGLHPT